MIINLFSVFDPCTGIFSLNWIRSILFILLLPKIFWIKKNILILIFRSLIEYLITEIKSLTKYNKSIIIVLTIFITIIINNLIGLIPYVFTSSSHIVFSLMLSLPMWIAMIIFGWFKKTNYIFSHLVPTGTPTILIPFIVLIETIRNIIRPGSLAVRLTANIIAGHLLISLLGGRLNNSVIISIFIILLIILITFEFAVALIQSYVFITLLTLYSREV